MVTGGELEAVVLGLAGLERIGRLDAVTQIFEPDEMLPAPGQGALAVECAAGRADLAAELGCLDDPPSRAATTAERAVLAGLQAGCSAPVGAYAAGTSSLRLDAVVAAADGGMALRASAAGRPEQAGDLGRQVAAELLSRGAGRYQDVSAGHLRDGDG
jgi:hydroxymethylbilane synthase